MQDESSPVQDNATVPRTQDLPIWLVVAVLVLCLAVGAGGVWWYFAAQNRPRAIVVTTTETRIPDASPEVPPLPVGDVPATLVSLDLKGASPRAAFAALSKASKIPITLRGGSNDHTGKPISATYKDQPFWTVLLDLAQKTGYAPTRNFVGSGSLLLEPRSPTSGSLDAIHGPFLLRLTEVHHTLRAQLSDRPAYPSLSINALLAWEPTFDPLGISFVPVVSEATDDQGQSLMTNMEEASVNINGVGDRIWQQRVSVPLRCPINPGRHIARLKGYFRVLAKGPKDFVLEIPDPLNAKAQQVTVDEIPVEFKSLKLTGSYYTASFTTIGQYQNPQISRRFTYNAVRLFDDKGSEIRRIGGRTHSNNNTYRFDARFHISGNGRHPGKLVLTVPTDVKEVRVPFDFKDLPLP